MHIQKRYSPFLYILGVLAFLGGGSACKQNSAPPAAEKPTAQQAPMLPSAPGPMSGPSAAPNQAAGVAWTVPAAWEVGPAHQMRIATYRIRAIAGDPEDAECAVYFFGAGQGGSVEANLDRWAHQFTTPDGQSPPAKMEKKKIAGLTVSTLAVSGTYLGAGMMGQGEGKKANFRMRAAIVEAPQGLVFFKLTGPLNTVAAAETDFTNLLDSLHPQASGVL